MVRDSERQRISKELGDIIRLVKIDAMKKGKKVPSTKQITKMIAKKLKDNDIFMQDIVRFN